jgi:hypothetical protein
MMQRSIEQVTRQCKDLQETNEKLATEPEVDVDAIAVPPNAVYKQYTIWCGWG